MTTTTIAYGTAANLSFSGLNGLAAGSTAFSAVIDNSSTLAVDYLLELNIADISESGNKQVLVYATSSVDNTTFSDTSLVNMARVGFLDMTGTGAKMMTLRSLAAAFGGVMPKYSMIAVYNDAGVALLGGGNTARVVPITYTTA